MLARTKRHRTLSRRSTPVISTGAPSLTRLKLRISRRTPMNKRFGEATDGTEPTKKRRVRKNTGAGPLEIPKEMFPDDVDLMWVSDTVLGQPMHHERMKYE